MLSERANAIYHFSEQFHFHTREYQNYINTNNWMSKMRCPGCTWTSYLRHYSYSIQMSRKNKWMLYISFAFSVKYSRLRLCLFTFYLTSKTWGVFHLNTIIITKHVITFVKVIKSTTVLQVIRFFMPNLLPKCGTAS